MILALTVGFVDFGYEFCGLWLWLWQWQWVVVVVFFFLSLSMLCCGCQNRVVVVGVVVGVADGRGGYGWCCGCFLGSGIYYFTVEDILFYCDIYIILLC